MATEEAFARVHNAGRTLIAWSDGRLTAYVLLNAVGPAEVPLALRIDAGGRSSFDVDNLRNMLTSWVVDPSATPLRTKDIRSVPLARLVQASASMAQDGRTPFDSLAFTASATDTLTANENAGYPPFAQMAAHSVQALAAHFYDVAYNVEGSRKPMTRVADELCSGDEKRARNLITAARRNGYMTQGVPGRAGGHLTEKGSVLLSFTFGAIRIEREGK